MEKSVKIVVFVPTSHADVVRQAMGEAGAGRIGNYTHCTYSTTGFGRFLPQEGANPAVGAIGQLEVVDEERIETVCDMELVEKVAEAIRAVHPYEEVPIDVYQIHLV